MIPINPTFLHVNKAHIPFVLFSFDPPTPNYSLATCQPFKGAPIDPSHLISPG